MAEPKVNEMIEPLNRHWVVRAVLVKNSILGFCVDYCHLHAITKQDCYVLPCTDHTLDQVGVLSASESPYSHLNGENPLEVCRNSHTSNNKGLSQIESSNVCYVPPRMLTAKVCSMSKLEWGEVNGVCVNLDH